MSDLLMPARCNFLISAAWTAADRWWTHEHTAQRKTFSPACVAFQKRGQILLFESPVSGHFGMSSNHGRSRFFSASRVHSYYAAFNARLLAGVVRSFGLTIRHWE